MSPGQAQLQRSPFNFNLLGLPAPTQPTPASQIYPGLNPGPPFPHGSGEHFTNPPAPSKTVPPADSHQALLILVAQLVLVLVTAGAAGLGPGWQRGMTALWVILWFVFLINYGPETFGRLSKITGVRS